MLSSLLHGHPGRNGPVDQAGAADRRTGQCRARFWGPHMNINLFIQFDFLHFVKLRK